MAAILAVGALAGDAPASQALWTVADVRTVFRQAADVTLNEARADGVPSLYERGSTFHYGIFFIYVTDGGRQLERLTPGNPPGDGIYWRRIRLNKERVWEARRRFGNLVLEWVAGKARRTNKEWDRLVAILGNLGKSPDQYTGIPPEELPCWRAGIAPAGPGKEGACLLDGQNLVIANRETGLNLRYLRLDRVRVRVARSVPSAFSGEKPLRPDNGRFLLVRYRIVNTGTKVLGSNFYNLVVGDRRIGSDWRVEAYANDEQVLGAGEEASWVTVFDLTPATAARATRAGALEVGNEDGSPDPDHADSIARLRLSGS
jgi:hypothetical protein